MDLNIKAEAVPGMVTFIRTFKQYFESFVKYVCLEFTPINITVG